MVGAALARIAALGTSGALVRGGSRLFLGLGSRAAPAAARARVGATGAARFAASGRGQLAIGGATLAGSLALSRGGDGAVGGGAASADVLYSWDTGTATFFRLANGKIGTVKANGVWKEWRPYRPVVIPRRWNSRSMGRVKTALKRNQKVAMEIVKMAGGSASAGRAPQARTAAQTHHEK